jgi:hypothetical protein
MKKLVLFIQGLGGSAKGTWKNFPVLIGCDPALADQYDVAAFEYSTEPIEASSRFIARMVSISRKNSCC